jgi:hypothetical protein
MEWETIKFIWTTVLTLAVAIGGALWQLALKKMDQLENSNKVLEQRIHDVQLEYVKKNEIEKIESRIDRRFDEMRDFFLKIMEQKNG